jgi:hypothetical protein
MVSSLDEQVQMMWLLAGQIREGLISIHDAPFPGVPGRRSHAEVIKTGTTIVYQSMAADCFAI